MAATYSDQQKCQTLPRLIVGAFTPSQSLYAQGLFR
jgi:hypothetical protein